MKKPNDYFVVSGISTDTIVESVHVITRSSPIEGARALLAGNNDASIEASENKVNPSHCPGDEGWVIGDRVEEQDVADDKAAARKQLRANRKQEIANHLALKPTIKPLERNTVSNQKEEAVTSLPTETLVRQIVEVEDGLLRIQSDFNQRLKDAASNKISIRDNVINRNSRIQEISSLLQDDVPSTNVNVSFLPGEFTSFNLDDTEKNNDISLRNFYLCGTMHDSDFLLHGDVDLSPAAEQAKVEAKNSLFKERAQLVQTTQTAAKEFDESLYDLKRNQLDVILKLELGKMKLDLQSKQLEVLLEYQGKVEKLAALDLCIHESAMKKAEHVRNNKLKALMGVIPMSFSDIELSQVSDDNPPMLVAKQVIHALSCKLQELEGELDSKNSQASELCRQKKSAASTVKNLQKELIVHQRKCEQLQIEKLGKSVGPEVLDISPVLVNNVQYDEVSKLRGELESFHQQDVNDCKKKQGVLKSQLLKVTNENTNLLVEMASLREQHMKMSEDIKRSTSSNSQAKNNKNDKAEADKFRALSCSQKAKIDQLRQEIQSLKTKCGHVAMNPQLNL